MFGAFERKVAFRYLRARKGERFVSVIATFSLVGIALGVATLIIVMSVMNGFRQELLGRILGLNGHLGIHAAASGPGGGGIRDYDAIAERVRQMAGVASATPIVEGQVLKGPTAAFLEWAGQTMDAQGIAAAYRNVIDGLVTDERVDLHVPALVTSTLMNDAASRERVARETLEFALALA